MSALAAGTGPTSVDDVLARLRARGGRVTNARRQLLEALFSSTGHRTAEDLAAEIQGRAPDVHISTVYRNLDELERLGVVVHAHLGHGPATYHLSSHSHSHLVCGECGVAIEAPDEMFTRLADDAESSFGFHIDPHHFAVLGTCKGCVKPTP
ncbi:MAG TPA: Fur family transcriptional regulator [Acidimicrobiales bacterium]|nr:Fur family transcriptional regulator [Acidimicrobiales bacterium]